MKMIIAILILGMHIQAVEIDKTPAKLTLSKALYSHCLELTQSQQLFQEYILIGLNNHYKTSEKTLPESIEKYDKRLKTLQAFFDTKFTNIEDKAKYAKGVAYWKKVKKLLSSAPTKENAVLLNKLLAKMYKGLKATKVLADKKFESVKITGRVCYSSQEMASLYLMNKAWDIKMPEYKSLMKAKMADFEKKINSLKILKINTPEIDKYLILVEKAYSYFTYMYDSRNTVIPALIVMKSDNIFQKVKSVKKLYGRLLRKQHP